MSKVSSSPDRHSFQKGGYVKRQEEKGEPVNEAYLDWFEKVLDEHTHKFDNPESHKNNMEYNLLTTDWILAKVRAKESYAQNLYAAMCNNDFVKLEVVPILRQDPDRDYWSASWRGAGGIVADMRQQGDYIDWYCSGIGEGLGNGDPDHVKGYVPEGCITDEIRNDLQQLGWAIVPGGDWEKFE